jgi:hypothetical protein
MQVETMNKVGISSDIRFLGRRLVVLRMEIPIAVHGPV